VVSGQQHPALSSQQSALSSQHSAVSSQPNQPKGEKRIESLYGMNNSTQKMWVNGVTADQQISYGRGLASDF
jgi:hypothetical protein